MRIRSLSGLTTEAINPYSEAPRGFESSRTQRKTIGVLMDYMAQYVGSYQSHFRNACHAMGRQFDVNVVLVYGGAVAAPDGPPVAQNVIFELVHRDHFDGLVLLSTTLSLNCGPVALARFLERYSALPCCSVGMQLPGIPSVVIDNRRSTQFIVEHLIVAHGRRRVACINGPLVNPEAQERFQGYRDALERQGIAYDPQLVAEGNFITGGGRQAMLELFERGGQFDAVVAANDLMALAAIQVLRQKGIRVPRDVAVTGFDNLHLAGLENPPLTTVAQPFSAMAERAFRAVLDQIDGKAVDELSELVASFVVRRSCGCGQQTATQRSEEITFRHASPAEYLRGHAVALREAIMGLAPNIATDSASDLERLLAALQAELDGRATAFVQTLEDLLIDDRVDVEYFQWLRCALEHLRDLLRPYSDAGLESLWYEARDLIESANMRAQLQHRLQLDESYGRLLEISEHAWRELDLTSFRQCLAETLPRLGIRTASISLFSDANLNELEPYIVLTDGRRCESSAARYPAQALMAPEVVPGPRRRTLVVFSLVVESRQFGVVALEDVAHQSGFQMLRDHVSTALGGILLHHEVIQKTAQHERVLQERQATTKRIEALSILAGGVAHDLNNAIGPLVALPEVMLRDLNQVIAGRDPSELRSDLETIKSAALRAAQTITDLLTLGRQGKTTKTLVDLSEVIRVSAGDESGRLAKVPNNPVRLIVEVPDRPLAVRGSEAHLARAVVNLIRNAVEAISGSGEVNVSLGEQHIANPISGYETIAAGDYAVVTVSDTGHGIAPSEIGHIFEPFFSRKHLTERSGSGLGLSIVHGVVKEHDGFLDLVSQPGVGTQFTLYFPRVHDQLPIHGPRAVVRNGSARILLVDDEPIQLRTGQRILSGHGYQVETVQSGRKALALLSQSTVTARPYDLVVLDMNLREDQDGVEYFDQIRRLLPKQRVILTSGHAPCERVELAVKKGLLWLSKPYTSADLTLAVENALSERPSLTLVTPLREVSSADT